MTRRHPNVAAALAGPIQVVGLLALGASTAHAQTAPVRPDVPSNAPVKLALHASTQHGRIAGRVTDEQGRAIEGAFVTALGGITHSLAVSDASGRYSLSLPAGEYRLQVHRDGYSSRFAELVRVSAYGSIDRPITMYPSTARPVMAAGIGGRPIVPASSDPKAHPHTEQAWRLRHARRTALRDTNGLSEMPGGDDTLGGWQRFVGAPARLASSLFADLDLDGELRFLTAGSFGPYASMFSELSTAGVAYVSVRAPLGSHGDWSVRGTMSSADLSTWLVAGDYRARPTNTHAFNVGMSYGSQGVIAGDRSAVPVTSVLTDRTRNAGELYAFDRWRVSPILLVDAGTRVSYYDYLAGDGVLWNPIAAVEITPWGEGSATTIKAAVSSRSDAPGAAEFTPPAEGPWLPPQRLFSALPGSRFSVERTEHAEVGIEHQFEDAYAIGIRRFSQRTLNQSAALFGVNQPGFVSDARHYYVATLGDVSLDGWGVRVSTPQGQPVHGSIDYAVAAVEWTPFADASALVGPMRDGVERIHDITATVGADVPQTKTRMLVIYRVSSAYATLDEGASIGSRFDMQLNQGLPLPPSAGRWEVLLSVRNVLRDQRFGMSMLDELLAVSAPTRVVGGVQVKF